ncbi:MAG: DinB family protein [Chloroflexota bacterium]|nr:DinB family protein [Chloroflexota bacterium]
MSTPPMLRQMRHDVWATEQLLQRCRSLTTEQLQLTAPGTYGTIQKTFAHIVRANEGYLNTYGLIAQPFIEVTDATPVDEIAARLARVHDAVEELFKSKEYDFDRRIHDERRKLDLELWVPLAQFSHHGSDHRSQICTILTLNGLDVPELDVWAYATAKGAIVSF